MWMDAAPSRLAGIDRSAVSVAGSFEEGDRLDREYWWRLTPEQRLQALEFSRQVAYGYGNGKPFPRFQRVLEVAEMKDLSQNKHAAGRAKDQDDLLNLPSE